MSLFSLSKSTFDTIERKTAEKDRKMKKRDEKLLAVFQASFSASNKKNGNFLTRSCLFPVGLQFLHPNYLFSIRRKAFSSASTDFTMHTTIFFALRTVTLTPGTQFTIKHTISREVFESHINEKIIVNDNPAQCALFMKRKNNRGSCHPEQWLKGAEKGLKCV